MTNNKKQKKDYATPKMKVVDYKHKTMLLVYSNEGEDENEKNVGTKWLN